MIKNVYGRLIRTQDNLRKIISLSNQWENKPMYSRDKNTTIITLDHRLILMKRIRCSEVENASKEIQKLLKEDLLLFHNVSLTDPNSGMSFDDLLFYPFYV